MSVKSPIQPRTTSRRSVGSFMRRAVALAAIGSSSLGAILAPSSAQAGTTSTPVLIVHGYEAANLFGIDCADPVMSAWKSGLQARGFSSVQTVAFYFKDHNCDLAVPGRGNNDYKTSLSEVAKELSNLIETKYGTTAISISAHSMGGLIVRRMLTGVQNGEAGFSSSIRITDAVTSGSPHNGAKTFWLNICDVQTAGSGLQCKQMRQGSAFLQSLASNPQALEGTDWTLFGGWCDEIVDVQSATSMTGATVGIGRFDPKKKCGWGQGGYIHSDLVSKSVALDHIANALLTND